LVAGEWGSKAWGELLGRTHMGITTSSGRVAYQDFLSLWKDADPDVPILKEPKAEHAKLK